MRPCVVVVLPPAGKNAPRLKQVLKPADTQALFAQLAVEALNVGVLRGLAGLDVDQIDLALYCPGQEVPAGQLRPVVQAISMV